MKELSIFVDESGDFGTYNSKYAPQYILTMVFHDQEISIDEDIKRFDYEMANLGFFNHVVHTAPLIKKEEVYCNLMPNERRTIFAKLFYFAKKLPIKYKSLIVDRKECVTEEQLKKHLTIELKRFIESNEAFLAEYEKVILYYDNGQKELASILNGVFEKSIRTFERKAEVRPYKYKLSQVADMICTLELLKYKAANNSLTSSELMIFHSARDLKKDFLKPLKAKEL